MKTFKIMQEPGYAARARRAANERYYGMTLGSPREKNVATVEAADEFDALRAHVHNRYPPGHGQYRGHRLQWTGSGASGATWRDDDGHRRRGRRWRMAVTLANGAYVHDIYLHAWEQR